MRPFVRLPPDNVRVTMWDSKELKDHMFIGQAVHIYGYRTPVPDAYVPALPLPAIR